MHTYGRTEPQAQRFFSPEITAVENCWMSVSNVAYKLPKTKKKTNESKTKIVNRNKNKHENKIKNDHENRNNV